MDRTAATFINVIRVCLIVAPILASVMSLTSDYNRHPDEIHHFEAARYYIDHFLPPEIGDPAVRNSYSVWGVSYLNYHWIEYLLAGKFILLISPITGDELTAARLFNVVLFAALAVFFIYVSRSDRDLLIIPAFLLITPQVWYVFSYVNNDAYPLAISFLAAYQAIYPTSALNRFLAVGKVGIGLAAGLLLGLLLISKTNYYAFLIFLGLWVIYRSQVFRNFDGRMKLNTTVLGRLALIGLMGVAILGFRCSLDVYVNGETNFVGLSYVNYFLGDFEQKQSKLLEYQEQVAEPQFKPSTIDRDLGGTFPEFRLRDKGASYTEIFSKWRWHETSFESFVGVYGYMNIFAGKWYYRVIGMFYVAFVAYLIGVIAMRRRRDEIVALVIFLVGASISLFISSYLSWSYALQAQGRYLFPILPMLACLVFFLRDSINRAVMAGFVISCFAMAVYSFIYIGVRNVDSPPVSLTAISATETAASLVVRR